MAIISGTTRDDIITPTQISANVRGGYPSGVADTISASSGNDVVDAAGGNDTVNGSTGNDDVTGGTATTRSTVVTDKILFTAMPEMTSSMESLTLT